MHIGNWTYTYWNLEKKHIGICTNTVDANLCIRAACRAAKSCALPRNPSEFWRLLSSIYPYCCALLYVLQGVPKKVPFWILWPVWTNSAIMGDLGHVGHLAIMGQFGQVRCDKIPTLTDIFGGSPYGPNAPEWPKWTKWPRVSQKGPKTPKMAQMALQFCFLFVVM